MDGDMERERERERESEAKCRGDATLERRGEVQLGLFKRRARGYGSLEKLEEDNLFIDSPLQASPAPSPPAFKINFPLMPFVQPNRRRDQSLAS